jgi:hypothetical protein
VGTPSNLRLTSVLNFGSLLHQLIFRNRRGTDGLHGPGVWTSTVKFAPFRHPTLHTTLHTRAGSSRPHVPLLPSLSQIRYTHFARGPSEILLMFEAYFDDAGTHGGAQAVVLAGYIGSPAEWEALGADWLPFLTRLGIPYYRASECAHASGQFKRWERDACMAVHREAVEIITRRSITPLGISVDAAAFQQAPVLPREAFEHAFGSVLYYLARYMAAEAPDDKVAMVIEGFGKGEGRIIELFHELLDAEPNKNLRQHFDGPPIFRPKVGYPPLQAADVLAYEFALDAARTFHAPRSHDPRGSWLALSAHSDEREGLLMHIQFGPPVVTQVRGPK